MDVVTEDLLREEFAERAASMDCGVEYGEARSALQRQLDALALMPPGWYLVREPTTILDRKVGDEYGVRLADDEDSGRSAVRRHGDRLDFGGVGAASPDETQALGVAKIVAAIDARGREPYRGRVHSPDYDEARP